LWLGGRAFNLDRELFGPQNLLMRRNKMKLTPLELSKEPLKFAVRTDNYDFSTQRRTGLTPALAGTANATQTHNAKGQPVDRDND
jgi:hypothetical protein